MTLQEKHDIVRLYGNFSPERDRIIIETFQDDGYAVAGKLDTEAGFVTLMVRQFHVKQECSTVAL